VSPLTLQIGGQNVPTTDPKGYATLTPGYVGLYQVSAVIPDNIPSGDTVPISVTVEGVMSQAYLSIQSAK
jgi:uncharacterized protein (TIGR03437 family)